MNTQRLLLRIMLWSLAIAAVVGVCAVALDSRDWTWMVIGTGISAAVACALLIPASALAERQKTQASGTVAMVVIILEFIGSLFMIWKIPSTFMGLGGDPIEQVGLTMFFLAAAAILTMAVLWAMHTRFGRNASWCALGVIVATFLCFEIATWPGWRSPFEDRWWETGGAVFALLGLAVLCSAGDGKLLPRPWRYLGATTGIIACILAIEEIWYPHNRDWAAVIFINLTAVTVIIAHANICAFCVLKPEQRWIRISSIIATSATAATVALMFTQNKLKWNFADEDVLGRFAAASGIVAACGSLALSVLTRMNAKTEFATETDDLAKIELFCPRCRKRQSMTAGESKCTHCDLKIEVRFEEPRCTTCEYLLVGLTGNICPECGNSIAPPSP